MADDTKDTEVVEYIKRVIQLQMEQLNAERNAKKENDKVKSEDKQANDLLRDIRRSQDKYGRLNILTARSWRDFGNRVGNQFRLALTKSALKKAYPNKSDAVIAKTAQRLLISGSKGFGVILTKIVPAIGLIVTILNSILQMIGERGKYLKATSMISNRGSLDDPKAIFRAATLHASQVNNPLAHSSPFFAASQEYKEAYRAMLESATFARSNENSGSTAVTELIRTFDYIAAEGKVLGRSFQETAQLISTVGSQYFMGRGTAGLSNVRLLHDVLQQGRLAGFNDSNIVNMFTTYSKLNALSNNGILMALTDITGIVKLIGKNTDGILDKASPQQLASQIQSIIGMAIPFGQFIALTQGLRSFGRDDLSGLAKSYRETNQFTKLAGVWQTLKNATNLDTRALMTIAPGYFGGLQGETGEKLADMIMKNKNIFSTKEYEGLSFAQAVNKFAKENVKDKDAAQIQFYAQQQMFFEQPLQTIIGLLVSMLQSVVQIASVTGIFTSKRSASDLLNESMGQLNDMNKFGGSDNSYIGGA